MIDFSTTVARKNFIAQNGFASKYGLDQTIICAVAEHESGWNPWVIRYEPNFYTKYIQSMILPETEKKSRAFSWGLMQIMGQTAREFGFTPPHLSSLCDPMLGMDFGCRKLKDCFLKFDNDEIAALLSYNGGGNKTYPHAVQALKQKYA